MHSGVSGPSEVIILYCQIPMSILHRALLLLLVTSYVCCFWVTAKLPESTGDRKLSSVSTSGEVGDFISVIQDTLQSRQRYGMLLKGVKHMKLDDQTLSPLMDELSYLFHHLGFASYFDRITRTEAPSTVVATVIKQLQTDPSSISAAKLGSFMRKHRKSSILASLLGLVHFESENFDLSVRYFKQASLLTRERLRTHNTLRSRFASFNFSMPAKLLAHARLNDFLRQEEIILGRVANLYGRAHFDLGNWKLSVEALEQAVAVDPQVPEGYEWLARAYDRNRQPEAFFEAWSQALNVDPWASDRNVWPVFCMTINHPAIVDTPRLNINKEWAYVRRLHRIVKAGGKKAHIFQNHQTEKLQYVIKSIRSLECNSTFVADRNEAMHEYHDTIIKNSPERDYSFINFAYGMVFFHTFHQLFTEIPVAKNAVRAAQSSGLDFVHLGSNVGTETLYAALSWNLNSIGYDVLCNLVDEAKHFRLKYGVDQARFHCRDALEADLSNAGIVWIDNQSWDEELTNKIFEKLAKELPAESIVVEYAASDYHADSTLSIGNWLEARACSSLDVSWDNQEGTTVTVYKKRPLAFTQEYNRWDEYNYALRRKLQSIRYMVDELPEVLNKPLRWTGVNMEEELSSLEAAVLRYPAVLSHQRYTNRVLELFQRILFNWYCLKWFNLHETLLDEEIEYLEHFFRLHGEEFRAYNLEGTWKGNRMASYAYSHSFTVGLDDVDSTRFRIGTLKFFDELWTTAQKVLKRRGITINPYFLSGLGKGVFFFHGLGWDVKKKLFKVYLMYNDFNAIPKHLRDLCEPGVEQLCLKYGLISFTYDYSGKSDTDGNYSDKSNNMILKEKKVYVYPEEVSAVRDAGLEVPSYTGTVALMFTSNRGMIPLYDLERGRLCAWRSQFPAVGAKVADAWANVGLPLETISYQTSTTYSMYFPSQ